jgi:hypothetical protein
MTLVIARGTANLRDTLLITRQRTARHLRHERCNGLVLRWREGENTGGKSKEEKRREIR